MSKLPDIKTDMGSLLDIVLSTMDCKVLVAALRLRIFDHLDSSTAQEVAAGLESHPRNTELFLNVLAGMGLIQKRDAKYSNTAQGLEFLVSTSPAYLGDFLLYMNDYREQFAMPFEDLVRQGPPPATGFDVGDASMWAESARLTAAYQYSGEAQHIARIVSQLPRASTMQRMLDLGGGAGFYTMAIVEALPGMQGVVFEQPAVADVARQFIEDYDMQGRVTVIAGDYTTDDLQGPYDLVFASSTLNLVKPQLDELFTRVLDVLTPGGVFMTHQDGIREERTTPADAIAEFLVPEMMGADFAFVQGEIAESMVRCGFQSVRSFTKRSGMGEMDIDIAIKALE